MIIVCVDVLYSAMYFYCCEFFGRHMHLCDCREGDAITAQNFHNYRRV